jgi:hypothetical protein
MRKSVFLAAVGLSCIAVPASAAGIGDLAKVILGGNSVLKKAETDCGKAATLGPRDNLTLETAVAALRGALAPQEFTALDNASRVEAESQAQSSTFCPETKKKGILSKVGKAGKKLLAVKLLGI